MMTATNKIMNLATPKTPALATTAKWSLCKNCNKKVGYDGSRGRFGAWYHLHSDYVACQQKSLTK